MEILEWPDQWEMMEWMEIKDFRDNPEAEENPALLAHEGRQEKQETPVLKEYPDPEVVSEAPDRLETPGTLATKATRETLELLEPRDSGVCVETKVHVVQTGRTAAVEPKEKLVLQDRRVPEVRRGRQEAVEPTDWLGNAVLPEKLDQEVLVVLPENLDPWVLLVLLEQREREEVEVTREMTVNPDKLVGTELED